MSMIKGKLAVVLGVAVGTFGVSRVWSLLQKTKTLDVVMFSQFLRDLSTNRVSEVLMSSAFFDVTLKNDLPGAAVSTVKSGVRKYRSAHPIVLCVS